MNIIFQIVAHPRATARALIEPCEEAILCPNKIRAWAAQNAYTLTFLSIMFFITWILAVILSVLR